MEKKRRKKKVSNAAGPGRPTMFGKRMVKTEFFCTIESRAWLSKTAKELRITRNEVIRKMITDKIAEGTGR